MAEAKSIEITIEVDPVEDVYSDKSRLQVVLTNLLSNAIKYSDRSKEKSFIHVRLGVNKKTVGLSVKDNGVGIGEDTWGKCLFYRATVASKDSGFGLYIVKENITKLKGTIRLYSKLNQGTEFVIEVPNLYSNSQASRH